jgi:hypothetical protein
MLWRQTKINGHGFVEISTPMKRTLSPRSRAGRTQLIPEHLVMMGLVALFSIGMIGYLYGCGVSDD